MPLAFGILGILSRVVRIEFFQIIYAEVFNVMLPYNFVSADVSEEYAAFVFNVQLC